MANFQPQLIELVGSHFSENCYHCAIMYQESLPNNQLAIQNRNKNNLQSENTKNNDFNEIIIADLKNYK